MSTGLQRRHLLAASGLALVARSVPADEAADALRAAVRAWAGTVPVREGRVTFDISPLVENGNTVPVSVRVDSPMTAQDHVQEIMIFNERNPQREVLRVGLTPANGRAQVDARIRLATSQQLVALARLSDGSLWSRHVDVTVTLAACVES
jgi:sulfur-oxidizing protein SoxY